MGLLQIIAILVRRTFFKVGSRQGRWCGLGDRNCADQHLLRVIPFRCGPAVDWQKHLCRQTADLSNNMK